MNYELFKMRYLSVFYKDEEILKALSDIHLKGNWYDLDCTFSKGNFYKNIEEPKLKSDLTPLREDVIKSNSSSLQFIDDGSLKSIVFDPPFLFRKRKSINNDNQSNFYTYFKSYEEMIDMYKASLDCFKNKLTKGGYVFFKCQDMTDGKFYDTHTEIIKIARDLNFILKDIAIKVCTNKQQRDAKQQNCVAKVHSYWIVLKKGSLTTRHIQVNKSIIVSEPQRMPYEL